MHFLGVVAVLLCFWLLLSGYWLPFLLISGLGSAFLVATFVKRMGALDRDGQPLHLTFAAATYWPWLLWEIAKSAWDVTKLIIDPKLPISPTLFRTPASQKTTVGLVTFANSITLTPGTISIEVEKDAILVHAITESGAESLLEGTMDRRVVAFEGAA